jgi:hypothetical protein
VHPPAEILVIDDRPDPTQAGARVIARALPTPDKAAAFPFRPITASVVAARACAPATPQAPRAAASVRQLHIVPRGIEGAIDRSGFVGASVELCGWAASTAHHQAADAVAVFSGGHLIAATKPATARPDVLRAFPAVRNQNAGFSIDVPRRLLDRGARAIQVYALAAGDAAPLELNCKKGLRDVGC